jgi:hypothetical protein
VFRLECREIVAVGSLQVPHSSTENYSKAPISLNRKYMIRGNFLPKSAPALGAGGRKFESCRPDQCFQLDRGPFRPKPKSDCSQICSCAFLTDQLGADNNRDAPFWEHKRHLSRVIRDELKSRGARGLTYRWPRLYSGHPSSSSRRRHIPVKCSAVPNSCSAHLRTTGRW